MDWSKIGDSVAGFAPMIAAMLGGPLAGSAVSALEDVLGVTPGTSATNPAALQKAIAAMTPDQAIELKKIDADMKAKLIDGGIQLEDIAAKDRASARDMQVQTKDWTPRILAVAITLGFFGLLALECFYPIPGDNKSMLDIMTGSLGAAWLAIVNFFFGSSSSSRAKDDTISKMVAQ